MKILRLFVACCAIAFLFGVLGCLSTSSPARGGIRGTIVDINGQPLGAVRVSTAEKSVYSDRDGVWLLDGLPPQVYSLMAVRDQYETTTTSIEVISGTITEGVVITLLEKGEIHAVNTFDITSSEATINFNTRLWSTTFVRHGPNTQYAFSTSETSVEAQSHQVRLMGLTPATTWHFQIVARDTLGRLVTSKDYTFTTAFTARGNAPTGLTVAKDHFSDIVQLTWDTDQSGDFAGYCVFRGDTPLGPFTRIDPGALSSPNFSDTTALPGWKYFYRVTRLSNTGEESPPGAAVAFLLPGVTRGNVVWTAAASPYELSADLTISPNDSLTMTNGTEVRVAAGAGTETDASVAAGADRIGINVQGSLNIQGTTVRPVRITSAKNSPTPGDWSGINFASNANLSVSSIVGLDLSFAQTGIRGLTGIPAVKTSRIAHCSEAGIESRFARAPVQIADSSIESCSTGVLLASNTTQAVTVASCTILRCLNGIISHGNHSSEIQHNKIQFWNLIGLDLGNTAGGSRAVRNVVAPGSAGKAVVLRGSDVLQRNTLQGQIGVEIAGAALSTLRSNLILADNRVSAIGVLYRGDTGYVSAEHTLQSNVIWDIPSGNARRYMDGSGAALPGIASDLRFDPALQGGDPCLTEPDLAFDYRPALGSPLLGAGYAGEDVGAYDVPR